MKLITLGIFIVNLLIVTTSYGQSKDSVKFEMKTYYLVLLKKGPVRNHDSLTIKKIQAGHLAHIQEMSKSGKLAIAGPCAEENEIRGIFILNVATKKEAEELTALDPAIKSGRLKAEIIKWMSAKGSCLP